MGEPEVLRSIGAELLECPIWQPATRTLLCVDIVRGRIHRVERDPTADSHIDCGEPVGSVAWRRHGGLVAAIERGFALTDNSSEVPQLVRRIGGENGQVRMNDGKCDRHGRFWAGTVAPAGDLPGALYRLDPDRGVKVVRAGVLMSNGIGWSPGDDVMYYVDSGARLVYSFPFDLDTGEIGPERVFVRTRHGIPDGLTVDADGCVWLAMWRTGTVVRYAPDGRKVGSISLPASLVSSCTFMGDDLQTLAITTARQGRTASELRREPRAGDLFAVQTSTCGLPPNGYAG